MTEHTSTLLPRLAAQWRLFGLMATAFARKILHADRRGARGTQAQAEMLEVCICAALVTLNQKIRCAQEMSAPRTPEENDAILRLQTIAVSLLRLVLLLRWLRASVKPRSSICAWMARGPISEGLRVTWLACAFAPDHAPAYLDSS